MSKTSETWRQKLKRRLMLWLIKDKPHKLIDGLWVGTLDGDPNVLPRIESALDLIRTHDPRRYDRLIHDLERIVVCVLTGELARFDHQLRACYLDPRFVLAELSSAEMIAATIVHEATHARLWCRGIRYEQEWRHRIEAICFRRELAFAAKLPDPEPVRDQAQRCLSAYAKPESWTDAVFERQAVEGGIEALRYLETPRWLIKVLLWLRRRRLARN